MQNKIEQDLFFEIFSEEMPAGMQRKAMQWTHDTMKNGLDEMEVLHGEISVCIAPRRLAICIRDIPVMLPPATVEKRGPKVNAPAQAIEGFLKSNNAKQEDLIEKNGHFFYISEIPSKPFAQVIPALFHQFLAKMPWPKSMHWQDVTTGKHSREWIRPIHSVVCLFGEETVEFLVEGCGLMSGNLSYGHRFLSPEAFTVTSFEQYREELKQRWVLVDYAERKNAVWKSGQEAAQKFGVQIQENESLLDECTGLVDYPFVIAGDIDAQFMELPAAVLSTSMRVHQKYFATVAADGSLAPVFIGFSNRPDSSDQSIREGMGKVLRARLSDALFFYRTDLGRPLTDNAEKLQTIIFHAKLGSLAQKVQRLGVIAPEAEEAAKICKLDLVSEMVREFEELQGIMGTHYAKQQGVDPEISNAIAEHYLPAGAEDALPHTKLGTLLALADRIDTLVGFLGVGIRPTGSKDPFALRRAALGIIRILLVHTEYAIYPLIQRTVEAYKLQAIPLADDTEASVMAFIMERLVVYFREQKHVRYDIVQAVLSGDNPIENLRMDDRYQRAIALTHFLDTAPGQEALSLFRRVSGLLKSIPDTTATPENPTWKYLEEEKVYQTLQHVAQTNAPLLQNQKYAQALESLCLLCEPLNAFFEKFQINTEDPNERAGRILLLRQCSDLYQQIADCACIKE